MQQLSFPEIFFHILLTDFLRYFLAAGAAYLVFWIIFFKKWRHRVIQQKPLESDKIGFEFRYSMSTVFIFALVGFGMFSLKKAGYTRIYDDFGEHSGLWFAVSIVLMILLHDAYFYWTHRLMHHPKIFRHVHIVHHRSTNPSPWAAYSFHPLEAVVEAGVFVLVVLTIPAHTLALFIFLIYMIIRNVLGHLGIEFLPAWFIRNKWLNWHTTTTHHDLHHKHFNGNYGLYFTWWDRCLGTEQAGYRQAFDEVTSRKSESDKDTEPFKISSTPSKHVAPMLLMLRFVSASSAQSAEGIWQTFHEESGLPLSLVKITEKNGSIEGKVKTLSACDAPAKKRTPKSSDCPSCGISKRKTVSGKWLHSRPRQWNNIQQFRLVGRCQHPESQGILGRFLPYSDLEACRERWQIKKLVPDCHWEHH